MRERIDQYLDGSLNAAEREALEADMARDPSGTKLLLQMRSERSLRAAAYDSYMPTPFEARSLAQQMMAEAYSRPAGRIGFWIRRGAAVAAGLIIVASAFVAGQGFSTTKTVTVSSEPKVVYNVVYYENGTTMVSEFDSLKERNDFVGELEQRGVTPVIVAEAFPPGHM
jgi:anti-sigma factor RsiW